MLCVMVDPLYLRFLMRVGMGSVVRNGWSTVFMLSAAGRKGKCVCAMVGPLCFLLSDAGRNGRCCV